jgi:hypothetical protein
MQKFKTFLTVIGAVTILVLAANSAVYAATGGKFILGKTNKANKVSTLKRTTSGSALSLVTKSSANAPLATNGRGKVTNLNADMVDGLDSTALKTRTIVLTDSDTVTVHPGFVTWSLSSVPAGTYLVSWDVNMLPLADTDDIVCAVTTNSFDRQFAADRDSGQGSWIATWLSGSTVMNLNPSTMEFFCQTSAASIQLKQPLTISFTKIDTAQNGAISHARVAGRASALR